MDVLIISTDRRKGNNGEENKDIVVAIIVADIPKCNEYMYFQLNYS